MKFKNKILNLLILKGKKEIAEKIFKKSYKNIQKLYIKNHNEIIKLALINSSPVSNLKIIKNKRKNKRKNKSQEIPVLFNKKTRLVSGLNNIIKISNKQKKKNFFKNFQNEILLSSQNFGESVEQKKKLHEFVFKKKKFANFKWF